MDDKILGILELENRPLAFRGSLANPDTFEFRTRRLTVPGASVQQILLGDRTIGSAYVRCARQLEDEGVSAIITNCGFTSLFQAEVAAAVSVPVALSSLMLAPLVAATLPIGRSLGLVTYDAKRLTESHFVGAGWSSKDITACVIGIEGSPTWRQLAEPEPDIVPSQLIDDVLAAVRSLLKAEPAVGGLVLECAAFPVAAEAIRRETGLIVADFVSLGNLLVEASPICVNGRSR